MKDELAIASLTSVLGKSGQGTTLGNTLHKIAYDFGQDLTQLWATCIMKYDGTLKQNRKRWYDVTCPNSSDLTGITFFIAKHLQTLLFQFVTLINLFL